MEFHLAVILFLPVIILGYCPPPYEQVGSSCLHFIFFGVLTHTEARQLCHSADGELATVLTATQLKATVDHIHNAGLTGRSFWIDGTDEAVEGTWVNSAGLSLPMGTPFWEADNTGRQPDNKDGTQHCLQLHTTYFYYMDDVACTAELNVICETPLQQQNSHSVSVNNAIECPPPYVPIRDKCLEFQTWNSETWDTAKQSCGTQAALAPIDDPELLREIYLYLRQEGLADHSFWLGGSDAAQEGIWTWTDGTPVPMGTPFWGVNFGDDHVQEPQGGTNENCILLMADGEHYFRDISCDTLCNPLCQYTGQ